MADADLKETLHHYLRSARESMLWKLDGVSDYDVSPAPHPHRHDSSSRVPSVPEHDAPW